MKYRFWLPFSKSKSRTAKSAPLVRLQIVKEGGFWCFENILQKIYNSQQISQKILTIGAPQIFSFSLKKIYWIDQTMSQIFDVRKNFTEKLLAKITPNSWGKSWNLTSVTTMRILKLHMLGNGSKIYFLTSSKFKKKSRKFSVEFQWRNLQKNSEKPSF